MKTDSQVPEITLKPNVIPNTVSGFINGLWITAGTMIYFSLDSSEAVDSTGNLIEIFTLNFWLISILGAIAFALLRYFSARRTQYAFYKDFVAYEEGFLTVEKKHIQYDKITDLGYTKKFPYDHILGTGSMTINTAGMDNITLSGIDNSEENYEKLRNLIDNTKTGPEQTNSIPSNNESVIASKNEKIQANPWLVVSPNPKVAFMDRFIPYAIILGILTTAVLYVTNLLTGDFISPLGGLLILWFLLFVSSYLAYKNSQAVEYKLFQDRIEYNEGFFTKRKSIVPTSKITDISYSKGVFLDKIFNTGSIYFNTAGSHTHEIVMNNIEDSENIYKTIQARTSQ